MPQFGRNVQSVTANSTTTNESTSGAPLQTYTAVKGGKTGTGQVLTSANVDFGNTSAGSKASIDVNMYANDTPSAFMNGVAVGVFGVTPTQMSNNTTNASKDMPAHAGWVIRRAGTGPLLSATLAGGNNYVNGETITVSNAQVNAQLVVVSTNNLSTNASQVTLALNTAYGMVGGYGFTNSAMVAYSFDREKYVSAITVTAAGTSAYNNNSILVVSNGYTNAVFTISTNTSGNLATASMTLNVAGLFPNTFTAIGNVTLTIANAGGGAVQGNSSVTCFATLTFANSNTGGVVTATLGGRAGRTHTETLIASGSVGAQSAGYGTPATSNGSNSGTTSQIYYPGP